MTIGEIINKLEALAPLSLAESYDNVGLLTGDRRANCRGALVCLDVTEAVLEEAVAKGCNLVVAHHPMVFSPLRRVTDDHLVGGLVAKAIRSDLAVYAIHTNLDNILSGVNGWLADSLELTQRRVLKPMTGQLYKLHTFVPDAYLDKVRRALFDAGAGHIGNYSGCSFSVSGKGSFRAGEGTDPFVGKKGEDHEEAEQRLELVFPAWRKQDVVTALQSSHPYEEVAYDIICLDNPHPGVGSGIIGRLPASCPEGQFLDKLHQICGIPTIRHSGFRGVNIESVAICGGAGAFLIPDALSSGADVFLTADLKYHDFFLPAGRILLADIGHYESEKQVIEGVYSYLKQIFPTFAVQKTASNTNPVNYHQATIWPT